LQGLEDLPEVWKVNQRWYNVQYRTDDKKTKHTQDVEESFFFDVFQGAKNKLIEWSAALCSDV
jgi:hypothetical protein